MGREAWKCLYSRPSFRRAILTHKVGQTDLVFCVIPGFISGSVTRCTQHYKSLCAAVTICSTLLTSAHRQTAFWPAYMNSSVSWAKSMQNTQKPLPVPTGPSLPAAHKVLTGQASLRYRRLLHRTVSTNLMIYDWAFLSQ